MVADIGDEVRLDSDLVLDYLEQLFQSVRLQILRLRPDAVQLDNVVVELLGIAHRDGRDTAAVLDDSLRLVRPLS